MPNQRVIEADAVGDLEVVRRVERDPLVALAQEMGRSTLRNFFGAVSFFTPASFGSDDERSRAAVHDRDLGAVQFDDDIVDAEGREGSQQVFDGLDRDGLAGEAGGQLDAPQVVTVAGTSRPPRSARWNRMP